MAKTWEKEKAHCLRKGGWSIRDIASYLGVSKGTVSFWCRDISLTKEQQRKLAAKRKRAGTSALLATAERKRKERKNRIKRAKTEGQKVVGKLTRRDVFMLGLGLYWGEGYKKGNDEFGFTNSDPAIIQCIVTWLREIYEVPKSALILRVSVNAVHASRISEIEHYWSGITGIPRNQFTKPSLVHTNVKKVYENSYAHMGTLRIKVRHGAYLRNKILGSLNAVEETL